MTTKEKQDAIAQCYIEKAHAIHKYVSSLEVNGKIDPVVVIIIDHLMESQINLIKAMPPTV